MTSADRLRNANTAQQRAARLTLARAGWISPSGDTLTAEETQQLEGCEEIIENGLNIWYQVGEALLHIRDKKLYRREYKTFEDYCQERWQMTRRNANYLIQSSEVYADLGKVFPKDELPSYAAPYAALTSLDPQDREAVMGQAQASGEKITATLIEAQKKVYQGPEYIKAAVAAGDLGAKQAASLIETLKTAASPVQDAAARYGVTDPSTIILMTHLHDEGRDSWNEIKDSGVVQITDETDAVSITAPSVLLYKAIENKSDHHRHIGGQAGEAKRTGVPAALQSSESNEWYTPRPYLEAVRAVLGHVDIDPASNAEANAIVQAKTFYDIHDDGLSHEWTGKVFLNPPYGRDGISNQERWSHRLIEQYNAGVTTEAILLVNAVTDRAWFQPLWNFPICFTNHRVPFYRPGGLAGAQPVCGSAFIYFGKNPQAFADVFRKYGAVVLSVIQGDERHANEG